MQSLASKTHKSIINTSICTSISIYLHRKQTFRQIFFILFQLYCFTRTNEQLGLFQLCCLFSTSNMFQSNNESILLQAVENTFAQHGAHGILTCEAFFPLNKRTGRGYFLLGNSRYLVAFFIKRRWAKSLVATIYSVPHYRLIENKDHKTIP